MSTIYRYLDVLSVEKCIDNINDFIKNKTHIYHNVRYRELSFKIINLYMEDTRLFNNILYI